MSACLVCQGTGLLAAGILTDLCPLCDPRDFCSLDAKQLKTQALFDKGMHSNKEFFYAVALDNVDSILKNGYRLYATRSDIPAALSQEEAELGWKRRMMRGQNHLTEDELQSGKYECAVLRINVARATEAGWIPVLRKSTHSCRLRESTAKSWHFETDRSRSKRCLDVFPAEALERL
mmetsp:Transcript_86896/g.153484  ORF Transcript_86896/g.153484 Transcript_86896/m.153484 type:complete len:177 (+) Transcript_86896:68-598(+)